jgi:hypothetical protein
MCPGLKHERRSRELLIKVIMALTAYKRSLLPHCRSELGLGSLAKKYSLSISPITYACLLSISKRHFEISTHYFIFHSHRLSSAACQELAAFAAGLTQYCKLRLELTQEWQLARVERGLRGCEGWGNFCKVIEDPCSGGRRKIRRENGRLFFLREGE